MQKIFQFKQFLVHQSRSAMPVTTDACILGAVADFQGCKTILDIGTGTGLLSLMLAQRFSEASITGVEIDRESFYEAQKNFSLSSWLDRLYIKNADIIGLEFVEQFDGIICNPPFFENQLASEDARKSAARHTQEFNYEKLAEVMDKHLAPHGKAWVLIPVLHEDTFRSLLDKAGMFVNKSIRVHGTVTKPEHVVVLGISRKQSAESVETFVTYESQGFLSGSAQKVLREFYLHLP